MDDFINLYEWILTVKPEDLPPAPIKHGEGTIINTAVWLETVQFCCRTKGPKSPRATYGALQEDLLFVYDLYHEFKAISEGSQRSNTGTLA